MVPSVHSLIQTAWSKSNSNLRELHLLMMCFALTCFIAPTSSLHAQIAPRQPDQIVAYLGLGGNFHHRTAQLDGISPPSGKASVIAGGAYQRQLTHRFYVSGGLGYSRHQYTARTPIDPETGFSNIGAQVELISVPFLARLDIGRFLFINAGPSIDFEVNRIENAYHDQQSGIGVSGGIGAQYRITNVYLWANPFFKRYAVIPFHTKQHPAKLHVAGVAIGVDYRF